MSARLLLVVLRRLEKRKEAMAEAWAAVREDLRDEAKLRTYIRALRRCEVLQAIASGSVLRRVSPI